MLSRLCTFALVALVSAQFVRAESPKPAPQTVRLFTIGNSFSNNATHYLGDIAKAAGNTLVYRTAAVGGAPLDLHWGKVEKAEANPKDPAGLYASGKSLKQELQSGTWNYVTIQQASIKSHDLSTYQPYAGKLAAFIKQNAPGAELLVHETWEYRVDDPRFAVKSPKAGEPATQAAMYDALRSSYTAVAKELGVRLIPVGDAFHLANSDPQWGFKPDTAPFDPKTAINPALPKQIHSLNVGWAWVKPKDSKDGKETLKMDGHHASTAGEYLGACVFYETIFGQSVVGNSFVPKGLDPTDARYLQETAHKAVQANAAAPAAK